jgi:hypothetical protein
MPLASRLTYKIVRFSPHLSHLMTARRARRSRCDRAETLAWRPHGITPRPTLGCGAGESAAGQGLGSPTRRRGLGGPKALPRRGPTAGVAGGVPDCAGCRRECDYSSGSHVCAAHYGVPLEVDGQDSRPWRARPDRTALTLRRTGCVDGAARLRVGCRPLEVVFLLLAVIVPCRSLGAGNRMATMPESPQPICPSMSTDRNFRYKSGTVPSYSYMANVVCVAARCETRSRWRWPSP